MNDTKDVRIERIFDASIDIIWAMWTEAEHFANWYGPTGATIPSAKMDLQVGGRRSIAMEIETPNGPMYMFFVGEYLEIEPKTRLVYTEQMADADGNPITAEDMGMPAGSPTDTTIFVELESLGGRTKMVMTHVGVAADSPGGQGWQMALDKLEARVAEHD
jgi:uncharacterized protein YndB with AHSA1/START domain